MTYALLIDDDSSLTSSLSELATQLGLELNTAETWDAGLAAFHATRPKLVIADYNLPGSDLGLHLLLTIARLNPSVRLLLVSAYLNEEDVARVEQLGLVDRALRKLDPVTTSRVLLQEIRTASEHADDPTDWVALAEANRQIREVSRHELETLDGLLRTGLPSPSSVTAREELK